jgi:hypothetical protein
MLTTAGVAALGTEPRRDVRATIENSAANLQISRPTPFVAPRGKRLDADMQNARSLIIRDQFVGINRHCFSSSG